MSFVALSTPFLLKPIPPEPSKCKLGRARSVSRVSVSRTTSQMSVQAGPQMYKIYYELMPELGEDISDSITLGEEPSELSEIDNLRKLFVSSLDGTYGGSNAFGETKAEITKLIEQLELKNPTPVLDQGLPLLNGKWLLVYTSFTPLFPLMARGQLPMVGVGEIASITDSVNMKSQPLVEFIGPLNTTSLSSHATFEVQNPKRLQMRFEIGTSDISKWIISLENANYLGQKIELTPFLDTIAPHVKPAASSTELWLTVTYLDDEIAITRGDGGSEFVFIKEGSWLFRA